MKKMALIIFTIVILDPYQFLDYDEPNLYIIEEEKPYAVKVYGPEKSDEEKEDEAIEDILKEVRYISTSKKSGYYIY